MGGEENPRIYSREYYQRIRDLEERHWWYRGMRAIASELVPSQIANGGRPRVLDAGCGTGVSMAWARRAIRTDRVTGVDISSYALDFCLERGERWLAQGSVTDLPFRDASFDVVLCNDVLQHLPTEGGDLAALGEIHRVLRPGGFVLIRTNSRLGMPRAAAADRDFQRYTLPEVVGRVRASGFVVERASYANALPAIYASVTARLRRPQPSRHCHEGTVYDGLAVRESVVRRGWLNRCLAWILASEARYLSGPNRRLPFGHTVVCVGVRPR